MNAIRRRVDTEALAAALPGWIVARFLVAAGLVVALVVVDRLTPGSEPVQLSQRFLAWDGSWYANITEHGYSELPREAVRFFPLFPLLGRVVSVPLLGHAGAALLVVANGFALVAGALVYRLAREEGADATAAQRAAWLFALFPSSFVLVWGYAEPLMLTASAACFLALRRQRWGWAAAFGVAAALARPLGLLLVIPAAIEALRGVHASGGRDRGMRLLAVCAPALGTVSYLVWSSVVFDDAWLPFSTQAEFRGEDNPISRLATGVGDLFGSQGLADGLHLPYAIGLVVLAFLVFRWLPASYGAYSAAVLLVALSADNLNSLERYGLNAFPLIIALALATRDEVIGRLALVSCAGGILAFSTLAWVGAYVP